MPGIFLVDNVDFARSLGDEPEKATEDSVSAWLQAEWIGKGGGVFNYVPSMMGLVDGFAGRISKKQAVSHCRAYWHPRGRIENEAVVEAFWPFVTENVCTVYKRSFLAAPIGRWEDQTIYLGVKVPLIRVTKDNVLATMPVFRKTFVPNEKALNVALTGVREFCLREGYSDIEPELIRALGVSGQIDRQLFVAQGHARALYSGDAFDEFANVFTKAVVRLANNGIGLERPNFRGYRVMDPDQKGMF